MYLIGRYAMEPETGSHTNKVAHLGFDLLRANIVTRRLTLRHQESPCDAIGPPASAARSRRAMRR